MGTFRQTELEQSVLSALREKSNRNGMRQHQPVPVSTRTRTEIERSLNTPEAEVAPRPATQAGTGSLADYVGGTVRSRLDTVAAKKRDEPKLTPQQIEHKRAVDFYYNEYQKEQAAERQKKEAAERAQQEKIEAEQRARQAKVEAARRHREIEEHNAKIAEQNLNRGEIRRQLADASPAEIEVVIARVRAEHCEGLPDAYGIHLQLLRDETEAAIAEAARERQEGL